MRKIVLTLKATLSKLGVARLGDARVKSRTTALLIPSAFFCAFALCLPAVLVAAEAPSFTLVPDWPKPLPHNWKLRPITGLTVDKQGHVWIAQFAGTPPPGSVMAKYYHPDDSNCCGAPPIIEFDQEGNYVQGWGGPGKGYDWPKLPHGIYVDYKGFVWIAGTNSGDSADGQVLKFTRDGKFVMQIGHPGKSGGAADTSSFDRPANFSVDSKTNELFVADGYGNRRIIVLDADTGKFKRMWGAYGKPPVDKGPEALNNFNGSDPVDPNGPPPPHFNSPVHCAVLAQDDLLYVCDRSNGRVQVFHTDGTYVREFLFKGHGDSGGITDVVLWPDAKQTYLIAASSSAIFVLRRADGQVLSNIGQSEETFIHMLGMDQHGNLYTGEVNQRVQKWAPTQSPGH